MGKFAVKKAKKGFHFNLVAGNGQVVGSSQIYASEDTCKAGIASVGKCAPVAKIEDQTVEGFEEMKNPKFEIYKDKKGEFRFRLKAKNGEIILSSEGYKAKPSCKGGIASVVANAASPVVKEEPAKKAPAKKAEK